MFPNFQIKVQLHGRKGRQHGINLAALPIGRQNNLAETGPFHDPGKDTLSARCSEATGEIMSHGRGPCICLA